MGYGLRTPGYGCTRAVARSLWPVAQAAGSASRCHNRLVLSSSFTATRNIERRI
jgi:hypothetical protein